MSKRTGKAVTMRDLIDEVGLDAVRYFFAMRSADTHMDFDLDLAVSTSNENPVYYAQYAHARICSMLRQGEEKGISFERNLDLTKIASEKEYDLLKVIGSFPEAVADAAEKRIPHRITNYILNWHLCSTVFTMLRKFSIRQMKKKPGAFIIDEGNTNHIK